MLLLGLCRGCPDPAKGLTCALGPSWAAVWSRASQNLLPWLTNGRKITSAGFGPEFSSQPGLRLAHASLTGSALTGCDRDAGEEAAGAKAQLSPAPRTGPAELAGMKGCKIVFNLIMW